MGEEKILVRHKESCDVPVENIITRSEDHPNSFLAWWSVDEKIEIVDE